MFLLGWWMCWQQFEDGFDRFLFFWTDGFAQLSQFLTENQ
jgi:hypothetical protein